MELEQSEEFPYMKKPELDEFGQLFIKEVRDRALQEFEKTFEGGMKDDDSKALFEMYKSNPACQELLKLVAAYAVDSTLHNALFFFEQNDQFTLSASSPSGPIDLNQESDGLAGEIFGEGWITKYSKYPHSLLGS